jgi:hypothetical protein
MTLTGHSPGLAALANVSGHELSETRNPQFLQGRRAFEGRIVRQRDIVSEYRN